MSPLRNAPAVCVGNGEIELVRRDAKFLSSGMVRRWMSRTTQFDVHMTHEICIDRVPFDCALRAATSG